MKRTAQLILLLAASLAGCVTHQPYNGPTSYAGEGEKVPFAIDLGIPVVECEINGVPGKFLIDSGATMSTLSDDFCKRAHLAYFDSTTATDQINDQHSQEMPIVKIPEISLGGMHFRGIEAAVRNSNLPIDGAIGADVLFGGPPLTIDGPGRCLIWKSDASGEPVPLEVLRSGPKVMRIIVSGHIPDQLFDIDYTIDTGANLSFLLPDCYQGEVKHLKKTINFTTVHEKNQIMDIPYVDVPDLKLANVHIPMTFVLLKGEQPKNILGFPFFKDRQVTIDAHNSVMYIRNSSRTDRGP